MFREELSNKKKLKEKSYLSLVTQVSFAQTNFSAANQSTNLNSVKCLNCVMKETKT
jgi:hypothetical protein